MQLTQHTDFALRMLMSLAAEEGRVVTVEAIAARHNLSRNHLMKVAQSLAQNGFIRSLRGRSGGLQLARPASDIRVGDVVRALEDVAVVECLRPEAASCILAPCCLLTRGLARAAAAFLAELDMLSLADLVPVNGRRIRDILAG